MGRVSRAAGIFFFPPFPPFPLLPAGNRLRKALSLTDPSQCLSLRKSLLYKMGKHQSLFNIQGKIKGTRKAGDELILRITAGVSFTSLSLRLCVVVAILTVAFTLAFPKARGRYQEMLPSPLWSMYYSLKCCHRFICSQNLFCVSFPSLFQPGGEISCGLVLFYSHCVTGAHAST